MAIKEQDFKKIVKKARLKNTRRTIVIAVLSLFVLIGLPGGLYLNYYNYGPFRGEKIAGVPDNHLVQVENQMDLSRLLFDFGSQLKFNTQAQAMTVYFDHYHKGEKTTHKLIASLMTDTKSNYNGYLTIGISKGEKKLLVNLSSNGGASETTTDLTAFQYISLGEDKDLPGGAIYHIEEDPLEIKKNVEIPLIYRGLSAKMRRELSEKSLELVGLKDRMHHTPSQLSGGQQQRVAIARALAGSPALILADEPTGALDSKTGNKIMELFTQLNSESGITIVQVTHEEDIAEYGSRILRLVDGEIVSDMETNRRKNG